MPVRLGDPTNVHGAVLVQGKATLARHHLDDLLAREGVLPPLGDSGVVVTTTAGFGILRLFSLVTLRQVSSLTA